MQIFEQDEKTLDIYHRSLCLLIAKDFALAHVGKTSVTEKQDSEQHNRRRELLEVEGEAKKEKLIEKHGKEYFKAQVTTKIFDAVTQRIDKSFDDKDKLYENVLYIEDAIPALLDILSVPAASIKRLTPLVTSLGWLSTDLVAFVNKPQYKKRADVQVNSPTLAVSYVGLDNLKAIMPSFFLKHWLPLTTTPFGLMKRKLWQRGLSIALATQALALQDDFDEYTAFVAGLLSGIGDLAVTHSFLSAFNDIHNRALQNAFEKKDKRLHDILVAIEAPSDVLLSQLTKRSAMVSADFVELMEFKFLRVGECMYDLAYATSLDKMSPLAQMLTKAKAYIAFRSLVKENLIDNDESQYFLKTAGLTSENIIALKRSNLENIKLNLK